jgi:transglutaminase-like putative cysteine protease
MLIRTGYELAISSPQPTPIITRVDIHPDRQRDIGRTVPFATSQPVAWSIYPDSFGNICRQFVAPPGEFSFSAESVVSDSGLPDVIAPGAQESPVQALPPYVTQFLLGSRYCETDLLSNFAWQRFGHLAPGWGRVQAICDFVHGHLTFSYPNARATRTALEAYNDRSGVCRDFAHLAITLCRCMNIPARYVNGYLGDIGVPVDPAPMDFSAWFEVYLGESWYTFDARHNTPRAGRIVIARGRDATDVPMVHSFGQHTLVRFRVIAEVAADATLPVSMNSATWLAGLPQARHAA